MLLNDLVEDVKMISRWERTSKSAMAEKSGITRQALHKLQVSRAGISGGFIEFLDKNGYDIEIVYKKKVK